MTEERRPCLIVLLFNEPILIAAPQCPTTSFVYEERSYCDLGYGDFTGFYDWLRNPEGQIIGVRYYPVPEAESICAAVEHLSYVFVDELRIVSIYFSEDRNVDQSVSDDQDFGDNQIFKSDSGEYALSFNAEGFFANSGSVAASLSSKAARRLSTASIQ